MPLVQEFSDLRVYRLAFDSAMRIFELSSNWPKEERYSLTDQIRRSSRSVCANIAEAWRKRLYVANFISKLSDANAEAAETIVWLDFGLRCGYIDKTQHSELVDSYRQITGSLIKMIANPDPWCGPDSIREESGTYEVDPSE